MNKSLLIKSTKSFISVLLCLILSFLMLPPFVYAQPGDEEEEDYHESRIVVSMGDSYASGEGIRPFYGFDSNDIPATMHNMDWLAHRSEKSWSGMLSLPGMDGYNEDGTLNDYGETLKDFKLRTDSSYRDENYEWYFVAASGATTKNINGTQNKTTYRYNPDRPLVPLTYSVDLPAQTKILDDLKTESKQVDYVTISIGGNDAHFSDIIKDAATNFFSPNKIQEKINDIWNEFDYGNDDNPVSIGERLINTYKSISDKTDGKANILVAGYPQLICNDGSIAIFSEDEAKIINSAVTQFNEAIRNKIAESRVPNIYFVSVEEEFEGHEAYSNDNYINRVMFGAEEEDLVDPEYLLILKKENKNEKWKIKEFNAFSAFSMHPNEDGARVYAECMQKQIAAIESENAELGAEYYTSDKRDIALVLDNSGSMAEPYDDGTVPLDETKKAATKFVDTVLQKDAGIGIVGYSSSAEIISAFSKGKSHLYKSINALDTGGGTNVSDGLDTAYNMLKRSKAKKKIIVLMSDGCANEGLTGDELINYADQLKREGIIIYSLGFFGALDESTSITAQDLMRRIASDENYYFNVDDSENLVFFFDDLAEMLNGTKYIYVRIACPVDVTVEYDGEKLCSKDSKLSTRSSFGSLSFEDVQEDENAEAEDYEDEDEDYEDDDGEITNDRVKVLRLKEGVDYDIKIEGYGKGTMDYSIGFMDEDGDYYDTREFNGIKVTKKTVIDTVAAVSDSTVLNVDEDGDGKYDLVYKAEANGTGKLISYKVMYSIILADAIILALLILFIVIKILVNKRRKKKALQYPMQ